MHYLLHQLLERAAAARPDHPAVIDGSGAITYRELDERSARVANALVASGVEKGDRVGLHLDKSIAAVVGIYGVLRAGAAYVPLDVKAPLARRAYITANCGVRVVLTSARVARTWQGAAEAGSTVRELIVLDGDAPEPVDDLEIRGRVALDAAAAAAPTVDLVDQDLAYILYTSGSTGQPKGVMLSHRNALAFVDWAATEFAVTPDDRVSSHAPFHFDLSIFDLFAAAHGGATVVLVPPGLSALPREVANFIRDHEITIWYSVPSILSMMVQRGGLEPGDLPSIRVLLFAGEVFPTRYLRELMARVTRPRYVNLYGPTETNVCTWYEVTALPADESETIPIGRSIPNDETFALTDDGEVAAPGEVGELLVRGATVMQGYWGDTERTARTLIRDPRPGRAYQDPVYRTGDLVRLDDDGFWRYLGRRDAQIKSRGYRIELGDIETAVYAHPDVVECAVVAIPDDMVTNRIRAYLVAKEGLDERALARFCADHIPRYMIPEQWVFRSELAKTSTGKVDRQALAAEIAAELAAAGS